MQTTQKIRKRLENMFTKKEHCILPDIPDPKEQLLQIWTPEDHDNPVYPKMKKPRTHNETDELYYDLSVIIPVYNTGKYLQNCIQSVLNQECLYRIQIIIVDDGSTDNSREILKHLQDYHVPGKDIQFLYQENAGLSAARNAGLRLAEGKYLMFLDSDDALPAGSIQKSMAELIRTDADFVQMQYIIKQGARMKAGPHIKEGEYTDYTSMCRIPGFAAMKIFRASLFEDIWFPENYWFEDTIIHLRIYPKCKKAVVLPHMGYIYLRNMEGITQTRDGNIRSVETILVTEKVLLKKNIPDGYMDELLRHFTCLSYNRLKYLPEKTVQLSFLTACQIIREIDQQPSKNYQELYEAFQKRDYGIWKWYASGKGNIS